MAYKDLTPVINTDNPYLTEAAMHADQSNQLEGYGYLVTDVGAFIYLGTVAGTAEDYEAFMPTKDITLRSDNTSSTIYFYDNLTNNNFYQFIRYNAATNFLEFGSEDGNGEVISARIDRGKTDWEFQDRIQILKPGRGVSFLTPSATNLDGNSGIKKYELRVNEGGVIELWTLGFNTLDVLVWSSAASYRTLKMLTSADMPYTLLESDKDKFLNFQDGGTVKVDGNLMSFAEGVIGVNVSGLPLIFEGITVPANDVKPPDGKIREIKPYGTFSLYKSTYDPAFVLSGDLITDFEIFESPNGTLYKVGVDDTGARTSIAL